MSLSACKGISIDGEQWFNSWANDKCYDIMYNLVYKDMGESSYNVIGYEMSQDIMVEVFEKYTNTYNITSPGLEGYNSFQNTLRDVCSRLPGVCEKALESYCHSCPKCNRRDMSLSKPTLEFCGCYIRNGKTTKQCDPLCNRVNTIQLPNGSGGTLKCNENICVINDVTIQAAKSDLSNKSVTFKQLCNNCVGGCKCIISGINITSLLNSTGITKNIDQHCGAKSTCLKILPNGTDEIVNCLTQLPNDKHKEIYYISLTFICVLLFAAIIFYFYKRNK
ncbi:MAG: hypothetical protein COA94_08295 [Rickettsiales bacterium]|nr:MAG: hypothetical protein COA94_08295 [Rickettsiales bacterium]